MRDPAALLMLFGSPLLSLVAGAYLLVVSRRPPRTYRGYGDASRSTLDYASPVRAPEERDGNVPLLVTAIVLPLALLALHGVALADVWLRLGRFPQTYVDPITVVADTACACNALYLFLQPLLVIFAIVAIAMSRDRSSITALAFLTHGSLMLANGALILLSPLLDWVLD